jgi:hypothetical protein
VVHKAVRNTSRYADFVMGYGGPVREFVPPAAYWGVEKPPAGGGCKYEVPRAVEYDDAAFAAGGATPPSRWASSGEGAVVHAFHHAYWGDWKFEVGAHTAANSTLHFARGGFQEARGSCGRGGHDWMVENVKDLLDAPEEWFYDGHSRELYYFPNASDAARMPSLTFVASRLPTLIAVNGTMGAPVRDVSISGLALAHAAPTFMGACEVPSAGDWSMTVHPPRRRRGGGGRRGLWKMRGIGHVGACVLLASGGLHCVLRWRIPISTAFRASRMGPTRTRARSCSQSRTRRTTLSAR